MVTSETLQVIIKAKDLLTDKVKQVNNALKQTGQAANSSSTTASNATNRIGQAYDRLRTKATSVFRNIKEVIKNSSIGTAIDESGLAKPFLNAAEKIKQRWSSMTETLKSKLKSLAGSSTNVDVGFKISPAGLATLNGQMEVTRTRFGSLQTAVSNIKGHFSNFSSSLEKSASSLRNLANETSFLGQGFSVLKGALAGVIAMVGYELASNLIESTRASINARGNIEAFAKRLNMSGAEVKDFQNKLNGLQQEFRKVDMQAVGAASLELAQKLDVPKNKIIDLTRMTATMSSAFIREGRSSQDAILAVSDALDGQFRRLQEIGITQDMLKNNGWNGNLEDTASLIDAINKTMKDLGIEETAMQVTNLDDAWQVLNVSMSHLLTEIIIPLTPLLVGLITALADAASAISSWWASVPDGAKIALLATILGALGAVIYGYVIVAIKDLIFAFLFAETSILATIGPIIAVGVAISALVFIIYEVGKAMGWWTDGASAMKVIGDALRNVFDKIVACLTAVYNGFMQVVSPVITEFWNSLVKELEPLKEAFMDLWDSLTGVGDAFGGASGSGRLFADIGRILGTIFSALIIHFKVLVSVAIPVITMIVNVLSGVVTFIGQIAEAFGLLMQGDILGFLMMLGEAFSNFYLTIVSSIGQMFMDILINLGVMSEQSLGLVWNWIISLITSFVSGASAAVTGFIAWICTLPGQLWTWLWDSILKVNAWRQDIVNNFIQAASKAVTDFIKWVSELPGKFWTWLVNTYNKVTSFKDTLVQKIKDAAKAMVDGFIDWVKKLPSKFGEWLGKIKDEISNRRGALVRAITNLGWQLLNDFKNALLGSITGSRADITTAIDRQVMNMVNAYSSKAFLVESSARKLGEAAVNGFINSGANDINSNIKSATENKLSYTVGGMKEQTRIENNEYDILKQIYKAIQDILSNEKEATNNENNNTNNNVSIEQSGTIDLNLILELKGVPENVDEAALTEIIKQTLQSKDVIRSITDSADFQRLDQRMKTKILNELKRHI